MDYVNNKYVVESSNGNGINTVTHFNSYSNAFSAFNAVKKFGHMGKLQAVIINDDTGMSEYITLAAT